MASSPTSTVTSKVLALLDAFDRDHREMTLSELSRRSGVSLATTHRRAAELVTWGALATYFFVPESIHHLVSRRPVDALPRVNTILARIGRDEVSDLPEVERQERAGLVDVFRGSLGRTTILIWIAFFCVMASFYFANSWTPKLLNEAGLSEQQGIMGGILLSVGGIGGALVFAVIALKVPGKYLEAGALVGGAGLFAVFALTFSQPIPALVTATLVGFFSNATVAGMYAVATTRYPTAIRGTGVGWGVGMGRMGAILSPSIAGWLLSTGLSPTGCSSSS